VLSASSDGTIKLWSLGQQKCIGTIRVHTEGVWTLAALQDGSAFTTVYSAGRDGRVMCTDFRDARFNSYLVCQENAPVLKVKLFHNDNFYNCICHFSGSNFFGPSTEFVLPNIFCVSAIIIQIKLQTLKFCPCRLIRANFCA